MFLCFEAKLSVLVFRPLGRVFLCSQPFFLFEKQQHAETAEKHYGDNYPKAILAFNERHAAHYVHAEYRG